MTPRQRRLAAVAAALGLVALAAVLLLGALRQNLNFFLAPGELLQQRPAPAQRLRLGGVVEPGSLRREPGSMTVHFVVAEGTHRVPVRYSGLLPDLFGENQGVVAGGRLGADGVFEASEVLAKHDENYMPPAATSRPAWVKP